MKYPTPLWRRSCATARILTGLALAAALLPAGEASAAPAPRDRPRIDPEVETAWRTVTWEDFKGRYVKPSRWAGPQAYISTGLRLWPYDVVVEQEGDKWIARAVGLEAWAGMDKYQSAVGPGAKNDWVLAHEQGHFDLAESMARRLCVRLHDLEVKTSDAHTAGRQLEKLIDRHFRDAVEELSTLQDRYDRDTKHSSKKGEQKKWRRHLDELLATTADELEAVTGRRSTTPRR